MQIILAIMLFLLAQYGIEWLYWTLFYINLDTINSEFVNQLLSAMVQHSFVSAMIIMIPIIIVVTAIFYRAGFYD